MCGSIVTSLSLSLQATEHRVIPFMTAVNGYPEYDPNQHTSGEEDDSEGGEGEGDEAEDGEEAGREEEEEEEVVVEPQAENHTAETVVDIE